ncbi:hypothetical protein ABZP36_036092 [Zizania latifolia]
MAGGLFSMDHPWASAFGILGNIFSFLVFLAPTPTFVRVYRKKSTEGFSSVPYVVALFSCTLWILYALVKTSSTPLLTINAFGCVVEAAYILVYLLVVVKTKSAEFMPFSLSFFLTLSAVAWFFYGIFTKDLYVTVPNIGGFFFGCVQMGLYFCYRKPKTAGLTILPTTTAAAADTAAAAAQLAEEVELAAAAGAHAVAVLPASALPVLAELHRMEQEIGTPRKGDVKTI